MRDNIILNQKSMDYANNRVVTLGDLTPEWQMSPRKKNF